MRFVYFGYDFMLHCVHRLMNEGHELIGIFTFECDNVFNFNVETKALANKHAIPITTQKPTPQNITEFIAKKTDCFLAAGYPFKIPPIDEEDAYAINIHPSFLPKGRGLMPTPTILIHQPNAAGLTAHKITEDYDAGDIIDQIAFSIASNETVESYSSRTAIAAPDMISTIFKDIKDYWTLAKPQDQSEGETFPLPDDAMRTLDWNASLDTIDKTARAFGRFGSLAVIGGQYWVIYAHDVWREDHGFIPGTGIINHPRQTVIAIPGGFFCIKEGHPLNDQ